MPEPKLPHPDAMTRGVVAQILDAFAFAKAAGDRRAVGNLRDQLLGLIKEREDRAAREAVEKARVMLAEKLTGRVRGLGSAATGIPDYVDSLIRSTLERE